MQKRLIINSTLIVFCLISDFAVSAASHHLEELKSSFPYGLLNDDHGVLTVEDLARNACEVAPRPFPPVPSYYPYEYWQCFESKSITLNCDSNGIPDEYEGVMGLIVVKAVINQVQHEYIEHRLWPFQECKGFLKDVSVLLKGSRYACIAGSFPETETDLLGHPSTSWLFERIKTKKGCEGRGCDFTKKFKQDNCPHLKWRP